MKTIKNLAVLLLFVTGYASAQDINVQGEKKLNTDFKKYKSFAWVKSDRQNPHLVAYTYEEFRKPDSNSPAPKTGDVVVYSYTYTIPSADSIVNNSVIRSVNSELEGRGYRHNESNPDLLVSYKVFDQTTNMKGYSAGPTPVSPDKEVHTPEDTITYKLKPGTLFISLIDAKTGSVVWEGYASGVARNNDIINDKLKVKQAVNLIFQKYEFRADKYSMN